MTEHLETMHCPDWVDAEPFRAHVRDLICETGLSWRLVAAHAGVAPRAVRSLLHGRRGYTLHRLHVSIARALTTTSVESIADDQHLVTDATTTRQLLADLRAATGLRGVPLATHVQRWGGGLPQYAVGHLDRIARVRAGLADLPGLAVCGAAYDGVGVAACIASGRRAAATVLAGLAGPPA